MIEWQELLSLEHLLYRIIIEAFDAYVITIICMLMYVKITTLHKYHTKKDKSLFPVVCCTRTFQSTGMIHAYVCRMLMRHPHHICFHRLISSDPLLPGYAFMFMLFSTQSHLLKCSFSTAFIKSKCFYRFCSECCQTATAFCVIHALPLRR